jgi:hypothetical protein
VKFAMFAAGFGFSKCSAKESATVLNSSWPLGVAANWCLPQIKNIKGHNSVGFAYLAEPFPGVEPKAQPRALRQNPVGIPGN